MSSRFFIDFDGTITTTDVVDLVLERFAKPEWREIEKEWEEGVIGSRECLSRQVNLVSATQKELTGLISKVEVDPYFSSFLRAARRLGIPVHVVSDGFDEIIRGVLNRHLGSTPELLEGLDIHANGLRWMDSGPKAVFTDPVSCVHGCANCKVKVIDSLTISGDTVLFVGDGLSDRHAARRADLTFAKKKLLDFCRKEGIRHTVYKDFKDLEEWPSLITVASK